MLEVRPRGSCLQGGMNRILVDAPAHWSINPWAPYNERWSLRRETGEWAIGW